MAEAFGWGALGASGLLIGSVLDGIPESFVLGLTVLQGWVSVSLLAMLADTLPPQAYAVEGVLTGSLVVTGFAVSLALSAV